MLDAGQNFGDVRQVLRGNDLLVNAADHPPRMIVPRHAHENAYLCVVVAGGFELFTVANQGGNASEPPVWWLLAVVAGTVVAVAGLTTLPARFGARRPVAEILQSEAP